MGGVFPPARRGRGDRLPTADAPFAILKISSSQGTHSVVPGTHHLGPKAHQKLDFTQQLVPKSPTKSSTILKHKPSPLKRRGLQPPRR